MNQNAAINPPANPATPRHFCKKENAGTAGRTVLVAYLIGGLEMNNTDNADTNTRVAATSIEMSNGLIRLVMFVFTAICISIGVGLLCSVGLGLLVAGCGFFAIGFLAGE